MGNGASEVYAYGIDLITDIINKPMTLDEAMENVEALLEDAAENVARILKMKLKQKVESYN